MNAEIVVKKKVPDYIKRAKRNYLESHRDEINMKRREYYHKRCQNDPEYMEKFRQLAKLNYLKKKEAKEKEKLIGSLGISI
jgi:hypothetical protein